MKYIVLFTIPFFMLVAGYCEYIDNQKDVQIAKIQQEHYHDSIQVVLQGCKK